MKKRNLLNVVLVLFSVSGSFVVNAQWNPDISENNLICGGDPIKFGLQTAEDGSGGLFMVWYDARNLATGVDNYMQHMDANGNSLWDSAGESILIFEFDQMQPEIIPDGNNGFYVIWRDERLGEDEEDFYMQHVDFDGNILWDTDGVRVSSLTINSDNDIQKEIVTDGEGGALIMYYGHTVPDETDQVIYATRINEDGVLLWSDNIVCNDDASNTQDIKMVTDGDGGAFVTWRDDRLDNSAIAVQHFNNDGDMLWASNGILITTLIDVDMNDPVAAYDGEGGVYIAWADWRNDMTQVHAQHIDADGNMLWEENGVAVSEPDDFHTEYSIVASSDGGALIAWTQNFPSESYAQKINDAGVRIWGEHGLNVFVPADDTEQEPFIRSDGFGGAAVGVKEVATPSYIKARNIKADGTFNGDHVLAANSSESKLYINMDKAADNNWIFSWIEERTPDAYHVYASKIEFTPYTTSILDNGGKNNIHIYPNPNTGQFNLIVNEYSLTDNIISIYDNTGNLLFKKILIDEQTEIELNNYPPGIYWIRLNRWNNFESYPVVKM